MDTNSDVTSRKGVLKPLSLASSMAFVYVLLLVALMLVSGKTIGMDGVVLPALLIFLIVSGVKYIFVKNKEETPQGLIVGSFIMASAIAILMTIIL